MSNKSVVGALLTIAALSLTPSASAQTGGTQTAPQPPAPTATTETRPATTTTSGDTGLWFVPTGEILPARKWSFSVYRVNFDYTQGFTDVSDFPVTFGVGLADRAEIFGSWSLVRRIDRDVRPLFFPTADDANGGVVNQYPFVNTQWTGNQLGDLWLGGKVNITSEHTQKPLAFAVRGMVKLPTASTDDGAGTGEADFSFDAIVSKELNQRVELSAFGGYIVRGDPDEFDLLDGFRWGFGAGFPTRRNLRLTAELHGEMYTGDTVEVRGASILPLDSAQENPVNASIGLTWISRGGLFLGGGLNWNMNLSPREDFGSFENEGGDALGFQFRIGYHPGVRVYVPPPPPPPPPPGAGAIVTRRCVFTSVPSQRSDASRPPPYMKMRDESLVKCGFASPPAGAMNVASPPAAGIEIRSSASDSARASVSLNSRFAARMTTMRRPSGAHAGSA